MKVIAKAGIGVVIVGGLVAIIGIFASVQAKPASETVPVTASSKVSVGEVIVSLIGNDIRVRFDYDLVNGATTGEVDAVLKQRQSFGPVVVTGPGHYDKTIQNLPDGDYSIFIFSSGNPDYLIGDNGPSNKPLVVTLPEGERPENMGTQFLRDTRRTFRLQ